MKTILVDSSVWIEYFRGKKEVQSLNELIDLNQICVNNLILSELIPFLKIKKENELIKLLKTIKNIAIRIDWEEIIHFQEINLRNGINKIGITDLIILQNVRDNDLSLFSLDKHFELMGENIDFHRWKMQNNF
ncbi:MAG: PIN domain-containing protein [Smithella sp.]|nr:PIN domain-containing protein [Smithella sp.]